MKLFKNKLLQEPKHRLSIRLFSLYEIMKLFNKNLSKNSELLGHNTKVLSLFLMHTVTNIILKNGFNKNV